MHIFHWLSDRSVYLTACGRSLLGARKYCLWFCLFAAVPWPAFPATYYVDATHGRDFRSGTSPANAWQTLGKVNLRSFAPGDSILLQRDEMWRERLLFDDSGTSTEPITIGAYGTGAEPLVNGADPVTGWSSAGPNIYSATLSREPELVFFAETKGSREEVLANLDAPHEWYWASGLLSVYSGSSPAGIEASARLYSIELTNAEYVTLQDLALRRGEEGVRLYDTRHAVVENLVIEDCAGYAGILLAALSPGFGEANTIRNCTVSGITGSEESASGGGLGHGIFIWGLNVCRGNTIAENTVFDNGGSGILVIDSPDNLIAGNLVHGHGNIGIGISGLESSRNVIEDNEVYNSCQVENDCFGINLYMVGDDNIVRFNRAHDQYVFTDAEVGNPWNKERSGGIRFDGDTWVGVTDKTGNRIYDNIVHNEYDGIQVFNYSNVSVFNNTIYESVRAGINVASGGASGTAIGNVFKNNALHSGEQHLVRHDEATNTTFDNNVYYPDGAAAFAWNGTDRTFSAWRTQSGQDALSQAANPLLSGPAGGNFQLTLGSPCIDHGTAAGAPLVDIVGTPRPQGSDFDVGAYEYAETPTAAFSASPLAGINPIEVDFADLSDPGTSPILAWAWDFDNNGTTDSTDPSPTHTYTADGKHTVALTVTTEVGSDTRIEVDYVHVTSGPNADFGASPVAGIAPLSVDFTDLSTPGSFDIVAWAWDFDGDGTTDSTEKNPSWTFGVGSHTVSLTITADDAQTDTRTRVDYIAADQLPTAGFTALPLSGFDPLDVQFTDSSTPGTQPITVWDWNFGDGNTSNDPNPLHTYEDAGTYSVSLTVTSAAGGHTHAETDYIAVQAPVPPAAAFSVDPVSGMLPLTVSFTDESVAGTYPITAWSWDFDNDGTPDSTDQHPSYEYSTQGVYTVSLTVASGDESDTEVRPDLIQVFANIAPAADFAADVTAGIAPLTVAFTDHSLPGGLPITAWDWDFGDGQSSMEQNPVHVYTAPGRHTVTLSVTTLIGENTKVAPDYVRVFTVVYVDQANSSGVEDGIAWGTALRDLQSGIDTAEEIGGAEVWVAQGNYGEQRADAAGALVLRPGVHLYGGFTGSESERGERDWRAHETVVNGSAARAGASAYHVVLGADSATLDGFTVRGGHANNSSFSYNRGAGMYNQGVSPTVAHCRFIDNTASQRGGAMYNGDGASPTVLGCEFADNTAEAGFTSQSNGGAMANVEGAAPALSNCIFRQNKAESSLFAVGYGGAIYNSSSSPTLTNCTFYGNQAHSTLFNSGRGGAIFNGGGVITVVNCILWDDYPGEIYDSGGGNTDLSYSDVEGGHAGTENLNANPLFAGAASDDLRLQATSPCIEEGTSAGAPAADFLGIARPQGAEVDMGAHEFWAAPVAAFTCTPTLGAAPLLVHFTDTSAPGSSAIETWAWDFGNGETSSAQNPAYTFGEAGDFTVTLTVTAGAGSDVSDARIVTAAAPIVFTRQPASARAYLGGSCEFTVDTEGGYGTVALAWWFDNGSPTKLSNSAPVLTLSPLDWTRAGHYWCEATDDLGTYVSEMAHLELAEHLHIVEHPQGLLAPIGTSHTFQVSAEGGFTPLSYTWVKDGMPLEGFEEDCCTIDTIWGYHRGSYAAEVLDDNGEIAVSDPAYLDLGAEVPVTGPVGCLALAVAMGLTGAFGRPKRKAR